MVFPAHQTDLATPPRRALSAGHKHAAELSAADAGRFFAPQARPLMSVRSCDATVCSSHRSGRRTVEWVNRAKIAGGAWERIPRPILTAPLAPARDRTHTTRFGSAPIQANSA